MCFPSPYFYILLQYHINLTTNVIDEGKDLKLVDAPVSGGVQRASDGTLTV